MPMKSDSSTSVSTRPVPPQAREAAERVSFWMDAPELQADAVALDALLAACADDDTHDTWGHYHWLGDVLRQGENAPPPADTAFVAAVMQRVAHEPLPQRMPEAVVPHTTAKVVALPVAAPSASAVPEAANDAVFRWKWVAGVAALAAVVSVAWQVVVAPGGGAAAPQLAQAPAAVAPAQVPVWTERGLVLRDPQLEALLSANRKSGSTSALALQMPAEFLRSTTYNTPQR